MNCPKCGRNLQSNDAFCPGCGSPVSGQPINNTQNAAPVNDPAAQKHKKAVKIFSAYAVVMVLFYLASIILPFVITGGILIGSALLEDDYYYEDETYYDDNYDDYYEDESYDDTDSDSIAVGQAMYAWMEEITDSGYVAWENEYYDTFCFSGPFGSGEDVIVDIIWNGETYNGYVEEHNGEFAVYFQYEKKSILNKVWLTFSNDSYGDPYYLMMEHDSNGYVTYSNYYGTYM